MNFLDKGNHFYLYVYTIIQEYSKEHKKIDVFRWLMRLDSVLELEISNDDFIRLLDMGYL